MNGKDQSRRKRVIIILCWVIFAAGVLVQFFAPNLEVADRTFVIPSSLAEEGAELNPEQLIRRERRMQAASAILTLSGAIGLGFFYRGILFKRAPRDAGLNRGPHVAKL